MKKGETVLAFEGADAFKPQQNQGYPIKRTFRVKEGTYTIPGCAGIPKGHPGSQELAELFINRALSVQAQTALASGLWWGPTNRNVKVSDPSATDNILLPSDFGRVVHVDVPALVKVRQEWINRYNEALKG
jgi:putative spermidine/putrescine transport system substrate-binding protein